MGQQVAQLHDRYMMMMMGIFGTQVSAILAVYIPAQCKP
jgi:hypothetical protein